MTLDRVRPCGGREAPLDWGEVRRRLEAAEEELARGAAPSPEKKRAVLKERALALARPALPAEAEGEVLRIISFRLASETYGLESAFVREVHPLKDFTPLPGPPPFVLGIVNVRGEILSVVDLKKFFDLPEKGLGDLNKVIVIGHERMEFGILADVVLGAGAIPRDSIRPAPPTVTGIGAEYLKGVTGEGLVVLDAARILDDEKIIVHQEPD